MTINMADTTISTWFQRFERDEEQNVSLEITHQRDGELLLACGDGSITFKFDKDTLLIGDISSVGDKFVRTLVVKTKEKLQGEKSGEIGSNTSLSHALDVFSDVAKLLGCGEMTDDDDNDSDADGEREKDEYTYEDGMSSHGAGNVSSEFITTYYLKKRWLHKEQEKRAAMANGHASILPGSSKIKGDLFSPLASTQVLMNDLLDIMGRSDELGLSVDAIDDDIYNWSVKINRVRPDSRLQLDLISLDDNYGYSCIELQLNFAMDLYPFYPPLVSVVRPRFEGFISGRIATMKCLQLSHWDPIHSTLDVLEHIRHELEENGRVEYTSDLNCLKMHPEGSYSRVEHLFLKLGIVTEVAPRVQLKVESRLLLQGHQSGSASGSARGSSSAKRKLYRRSGDNDHGYDHDDMDDTAGGPGGMGVQGLGSAGEIDESSDASAKSMKVETVLPTGGTAVTTATTATAAAKGPGSAASSSATSSSSAAAHLMPGEGKQYWAKGTGYGTGSRNSKWSLEEYAKAQAEKNRLLKDLLQQVLLELQNSIRCTDTDGVETRRRLFTIVEESCFIPLTEQYIKNSSFVEMERHPDLYMLVFQALQVVAECEVLQPLLLPLEAQPVSLAELTETQLGRKLDIFLRQSAKERKSGSGTGVNKGTTAAMPTAAAAGNAPAATATTTTANPNPTVLPLSSAAAPTAATSSSSSSSSAAAGATASTIAADTDANGDSGDALMKFIQQVVEKVRSVAAAANAAKSSSSSSSSGFGAVVDLTGDDSAAAAATSTAMDVVNEETSSSSGSSGSVGIKTAGGLPSSSSSSSLSAEAEYALAMSPLQYAENDALSGYYYVEELKKENMGATVKSRIKRLGQEHMDLSNSLPLSLSSSVWLRASAERMDALQFVISGPEDTPYSNGLFLFDAFFPETYPNAAPKVNLQTTGRGSVRFNPNLYNCGKVCLSLLGTWPGQKEEMWNEKASTFLQVIVSIQSLIMVPDPYFNEPGYESTMGTPEGDKKSKNYNDHIRMETVRWAMVETLKRPPLGFEQVVRTHFRLRREAVLQQVARWCDEALDYKLQLKGQEEALQKELAKLL